MKNLKLVLFVLLFGLVIFGCTSSSNTQATTGATTSTESAPSTGHSSASTTPGASADVRTDASVTVTPPSPPSNRPVSGNYQQMLQTGNPLQCDATYTNPSTGQTANMKIYFKGGASAMRTELNVAGRGGSCNTVVNIIQIQSLTQTSQKFTQYLGCSTGNLMPSVGNQPACTWIKSEATVDLTNVQQGSSSSPNPASNNVQYSCSPWVVDESKFQTPGNVCDGSNIAIAPR